MIQKMSLLSLENSKNAVTIIVVRYAPVNVIGLVLHPLACSLIKVAIHDEL